jgi:hypothetical protein
MYDRDYVKKLEREIELTGNNHFEGWHIKSDEVKNSNPKHAKQIGRSATASSSK